MNWNNTQKSYGAITKVLHWAVVILIITQFALGITMASLPFNGDETAGGYTRFEWFQWHQSFGLLMLLAVIARIIWRRRSTLPDWAEGLTQGDRKYAHVVERVLYWLMVLVPLSGLLLVMTKVDHVYFFGLQIPSFLPNSESIASVLGRLHAITRVLLLLTIVLHVGFILKHQFVNRDRLLNRMLPRLRQKP
jgi:cytochrome b561